MAACCVPLFTFCPNMKMQRCKVSGSGWHTHRSQQPPCCHCALQDRANWHFQKSWTTDAHYVTEAVNTQTLYVPPVPTPMIRFGAQLRKDSLTLICYHWHTDTDRLSHTHTHTFCRQILNQHMLDHRKEERAFMLLKRTHQTAQYFADTPPLFSNLPNFKFPPSPPKFMFHLSLLAPLSLTLFTYACGALTLGSVLLSSVCG